MVLKSLQPYKQCQKGTEALGHVIKATKKGKCIKKGVSHFFASFPVKNQQFSTGDEAPAKPQTCAKQLSDTESDGNFRFANFFFITAYLTLV